MGTSHAEESTLAVQHVSVCDALVEALRDAGVVRSFGVLGGALLPLFDALVRGGLRPVQFRHETAAVFAALEHELAGGGVVAVFATTGPGLTNALTGIQAARQEGARVVVLSGSTGHKRRRRYAFQETSPQALGNRGLFADEGWFDLAQSVESPDLLPTLLGKLHAGLARPEGFVAHLSLPLSVQDAPVPAVGRRFVPVVAPPAASRTTVKACADALRAGPVRIWLGHGARAQAAAIRELVDRLDPVGVGVMCTPRGMGIFPSSDPRFLGVTGFGGDENLGEALSVRRDRATLVLGSRLGEFSSFWDPRLVSGRLIHVDLDAEVFGAAFPDVETIGVEAEIGEFVRHLLDHLPSAPLRSIHGSPPVRLIALRDGPVRPSVLMDVIQRVVVDRTDVPIASEAGNAFAWTTNRLRFDEPLRYRTSMGFGSMGHMAAGVVGMALARGGRAIAVVGDGSMLMHNEITTAVQLGAQAIWIVLNDARLGLVDDGMQGLGYPGGALDFPAVDFVAVARAMGAHGIRVDDERELEDALDEALHVRKACVVDVAIDTREIAPLGARNKSIADQTAGGAR